MAFRNANRHLLTLILFLLSGLIIEGFTENKVEESTTLSTSSQIQNETSSSNNSRIDPTELIKLIKNLVELRESVLLEQNYTGKKAPQQAQQPPEQVTDLQDFVRVFLDRNLAPILTQVLTSLNLDLPAILGEPTEKTTSVPLSTTVKNYIYIYFHRGNSTRESEPEAVTVDGLFKHSEVIAPSSPTTPKGKYKVVRNKTSTTSTSKPMFVDDDEDESDILKKLQSLP